MITWVHEKLKKWAIWYLSPVGAIFPGGGTTIEQRILEGRGKLLPGVPKGSGRPGVLVDHDAYKLDVLIKTLPRRHQRVLKTFYLEGGSVERRARNLRLSERKFYLKIDLIHKHLEQLLLKE